MIWSLMACTAVKDADSCRQSSAEFRAAQQDLFLNPDESPLPESQRLTFQFINYYAFDASYCIKAQVHLTPDAEPFEMPTSTERKPEYVKYAELHFDLGGHPQVLSAYKSVQIAGVSGNEDYLFVPFNDLTNGDSTYGGGRYMDLTATDEETMSLDFNASYHPYCAYDYKYSCPIPPEENMLDIAIEAGVRLGINGEAGEAEH